LFDGMYESSSRIIMSAPLIVLGLQMAHAPILAMRIRAAKLLHRHFFVRGRPDHVGPGDKHVRGIAHHHDEIGHRGRIDCAARARSHDRGNLRNDARRTSRCAEKYPRIPRARPRLPGFAAPLPSVEADDRASGLGRESMTLQTFSANAPDRLPPKTVKSWLKTQTWRPSIVPYPVTTPSPGTFLSAHVEVGDSMRLELVEFDERPPSSRNSTRLRAVIRPCAVLFFQPLFAAPASASRVSRFNCSIFS